MREVKREIVAEIVHRLAAQYVQKNSSLGSLITITRVELSPTGKEGKVFFTTIPENQEETVEKFLERKAPEFKLYLRDHSRIGIIPYLVFKIDYGERNRQRLDEITGSGKI